MNNCGLAILLHHSDCRMICFLLVVLEQTQLPCSPPFRNSGILHMENGGYRSFDIVVYKSHLILSWLYLGFNRKHHKCITFDPENIAKAGLFLLLCPVLYNNSSCKRRWRK